MLIKLIFNALVTSICGIAILMIFLEIIEYLLYVFYCFWNGEYKDKDSRLLSYFKWSPDRRWL